MRKAVLLALAWLLGTLLARTIAADEVFPRPIRAPKGMDKSPGPWNDPKDLTVWLNQTSNANGDSWLVENHDKIRKMKPRVLVINFSNEHARDFLEKRVSQLIGALAESSRYHGYKDPKAPIFLQYEVFKFVDLRDADRKSGNSRKIPVKDAERKTGFNMKYAAYFDDDFAAAYGIPDPRNEKRYLRLNELLDGGYVHEVWFMESGNTKATPHVGSYEVVELKPLYDDKFAPVKGKYVQAGNGGDAEEPWKGRSVRIGCINASRGIGCFLESLAHGFEGTSTSKAIPYFSRYFKEYAGMDLDTRYRVPFNSLYGVNYNKEMIRYPEASTMIVTHGSKEYRFDKYIATGGNAHFPPNARGHYDLDNDKPVFSTIEDWRIGSGKDGKDEAKEWTNAAFKNYRDLAPDCMGAWLVYWRQNMPGLDNRQKDDAGKPMKTGGRSFSIETTMHAHHDMGGQPAGLIDQTQHTYQPWEKRTHALLLLLAEPCRALMNVDQLRRGIEGLGEREYDRLTYYERWIVSIANNLVQRGVFTVDELGRKLAEIEARGEQAG